MKYKFKKGDKVKYHDDGVLHSDRAVREIDSVFQQENDSRECVRYTKQFGGGWDWAHSLELVERKETLEDKILSYQKFLGREDLVDENGEYLMFVPERIEIRYGDEDNSFTVSQAIESNGFCIAAISANGDYTYPAEWVSLPVSKKVGEFEVTKEAAEINGEKISLDTLREIIRVSESI